eukprot:768309-Hanusia_phi.AAC.3
MLVLVLISDYTAPESVKTLQFHMSDVDRVYPVLPAATSSTFFSSPSRSPQIPMDERESAWTASNRGWLFAECSRGGSYMRECGSYMRESGVWGRVKTGRGNHEYPSFSPWSPPVPLQFKAHRTPDEYGTTVTTLMM